MKDAIAEKNIPVKEDSSPKKILKSLFPLEGLKRGTEGINDGWSLDKAIKFIKKLNVDNTNIYTAQSERSLHIFPPSPNPFNRLQNTPESFIYITNQCKEKLYGTENIIYPEEYRLTIELDTKGPQGNPPIKKIEVSTVFSKGETEKFIRKSLGQIPENWEFNP